MKHVLFLLCAALSAQGPAAKPLDPKEIPTTYILGPDDQVLVRALDAEEIGNTPVRVDLRGNINLPMIGRVHAAAGLTTEQLEEELETRLKKYIQQPDVTVYLTEFRSQPISILGSVQTPGVHQLQGRKTLFEVLSTAGGLRPDSGPTVKIARKLEWGRIPLPNAQDDASGQFSIAAVSIKSILNATNPQENILVKPNDIISVPKGEIIYVIGAVRKSGGFLLGENETLSALQVLSLAEGLDRMAASRKVKIMRNIPGSAERTEIIIDLRAMLDGKTKDVPLKADDILFIPTNTSKAVAVRSLEAALGIGTNVTTGLVIYRR